MSGDLTEQRDTEQAAREGQPAAPTGKGPVDRLLDGTIGLSGLLLWGMTLTVSASVTARYFLGRPLASLFEIAEYGLLAITVIAAAAIARDDGHVRMDLVEQFAPAGANRALDYIADLIVLVIAAVIAVASAYVTYTSYRSGVLTTTFMRLPRWPILLMIPIGMSLVVLEQVRRLAGRWRRGR